MQQQVLSFISGFQASIYDSINKTGNILVGFLKSFTDKERVVQILGEDEREHVVTISKDQLDSIRS